MAQPSIRILPVSGQHTFIVYTGDGTSGRTIPGAGFTPELVFIKAHGGGSALGSCFKITEHVGTNCSRWNGPDLASGGIESFTSDGFTVGSNVLVNQTGVKYVAFCVFGGNEDFFRHGTYIGNGLDDHIILTSGPVGWFADFLFIKRAGSDSAVYRGPSHGGFDSTVDESTYLKSSGTSTGLIKKAGGSSREAPRQTEGSLAFVQPAVRDFHLGTDPAVNASGELYYWFAWQNFDDELDFITGGSYIGDGVSGGDVLPFAPDWVMLKPQTAGHDAMWKHSSHPVGMPGKSSSWGTSADLDFRITEFKPLSFVTGFLGSIDGVVHHYMAISATSFLTSINPKIGLTRGGLLVQIAGIGFEAGARVTFDRVENAEATDVVLLSSELIQCTTPPHPTPGVVDVVVTNPGGELVIAAAFEYVEPTVTPDNGPFKGGTRCIINGAEFPLNPKVFFGFEEALEVVRVSSKLITCISPPQAKGPVDVVVV